MPIPPLLKTDTVESVLQNCTRLQRGFAQSRRNWRQLAVENDLPPEHVDTLLCFIHCAQRWKTDPKRLERLTAAQFYAKKNRGKFGFRNASELRNKFNDKAVNRAISLAIVGYLDALGETRVRVRHWRPIIEHLHVLLLQKPVDEYDEKGLERRVLDIIRQRVRTLQQKNNGKLPVSEARTAYKKVYATFQK